MEIKKLGYFDKVEPTNEGIDITGQIISVIITLILFYNGVDLNDDLTITFVNIWYLVFIPIVPFFIFLRKKIWNRLFINKYTLKIKKHARKEKV